MNHQQRVIPHWDNGTPSLHVEDVIHSQPVEGGIVLTLGDGTTLLAENTGVIATTDEDGNVISRHGVERWPWRIGSDGFWGDCPQQPVVLSQDRHGVTITFADGTVVSDHTETGDIWWRTVTTADGVSTFGPFRTIGQHFEFEVWDKNGVVVKGTTVYAIKVWGEWDIIRPLPEDFIATLLTVKW